MSISKGPTYGLSYALTAGATYSINITETIGNLKKTGLNGYVYDFPFNYDSIVVDDILNIYEYI